MQRKKKNKKKKISDGQEREEPKELKKGRAQKVSVVLSVHLKNFWIHSAYYSLYKQMSISYHQLLLAKLWFLLPMQLETS